jgi:hypothetical protein
MITWNYLLQQNIIHVCYSQTPYMIIHSFLTGVLKQMFYNENIVEIILL